MKKPKLTPPQWVFLQEVARQDGEVSCGPEYKPARALIKKGLLLIVSDDRNGRLRVKLSVDGSLVATCFRRRSAGEIVRKHPGAGFVGEGSLVIIQPEESPYDHYPCMMGCGDKCCREWVTCLECDAAGNLLGGMACHVSECEMSDP